MYCKQLPEKQMKLSCYVEVNNQLYRIRCLEETVHRTIIP